MEKEEIKDAIREILEKEKLDIHSSYFVIKELLEDLWLEIQEDEVDEVEEAEFEPEEAEELPEEFEPEEAEPEPEEEPEEVVSPRRKIAKRPKIKSVKK